MTDKPLLWVGSAHEDLRALSADVRRELGIDLRRVQQGDMPRDWKPMASIGVGVVEIRVRVAGAYRLLYVAKFAEGIYVLHVFQKKSQKTSGIDLDVAERFLGALGARRPSLAFRPGLLVGEAFERLLHPLALALPADVRGALGVPQVILPDRTSRADYPVGQRLRQTANSQPLNLNTNSSRLG